MRRLVAVAALLLLSGPASASLIESLPSTLRDAVASDPVLGPTVADSPLGPALDDTHVHYQADAGTEFDAPDTCEAALASPLPFDLPIGGALDGLLVPVDDEVDHYRVAIGQELVGGRVTLSVLGREASLPLAIEAFMPACGTSVTEEENQPFPAPTHPEPAAGEKQVTPHNVGDSYECSSRWFFVLNQFGGRTAPASIHVVWTDGTEADVPLLKDTPATMAQYATTENLAFKVDSASANVPADWSGQFNLAEGPCTAVDGGAVFGDPAAATESSISFTPIEAGTYVLAVRMIPPELAPPSTTVPASCHQFCAALPGAGMDLSGYTASAL